MHRKNALSNNAMKKISFQEGVIVSSPGDSGSEKGNLLVQLDNGTQLTFPSQLLQSCVDPESDTDDSDAETDVSLKFYRRIFGTASVYLVE